MPPLQLSKSSIIPGEKEALNPVELVTALVVKVRVMLDLAVIASID